MSTKFFRDTLDVIADRGRLLIERASARANSRWVVPQDISPNDRMEVLCRALLSERGEASGVALAQQVLDAYGAMTPEQRHSLFHQLAQTYGPDAKVLSDAWRLYEEAPDPARFRHLLQVIEPPRQELFRRLNLAPGGTSALVRMRKDLLDRLPTDTGLSVVDDDLVHLLASWFNRGFLVMQRINWSSPADILERLIRYEAVHMIQGWDDLRRRVQPSDRRCYAFFHPSLTDEPLIFVEVALTKEIPESIQGILADDRDPLLAGEATTAVFYSISNCQPGLRGISFGNFLIKQVVQDLKQDLPGLETFVTLSPAPGFGRWLKTLQTEQKDTDQAETAVLAAISKDGWHLDKALAERTKPVIEQLAARYYLKAKNDTGQPLDPVARFHLGNGARLERINWLGDTSPKGLRESAGVMVNYLYDLKVIEANHEAYAHSGKVFASAHIEKHYRNQNVLIGRETRNV